MKKLIFKAGLISPICFIFYKLQIQQPHQSQKSDKQGKVTCQCEQTSISFRSFKPLFHLQCSCFDCRLRVQWLGLQQGHKTDQYKGPINGFYMPNAITQVVNEQNLQCLKLRQKSLTTFIIAQCCNTLMVVENPVYLNNVCAVSDIAKLDIDSIECNARVFTKDWEILNNKKIPKYEGKGPVIQGHYKFEFVKLFLAGYLTALFTRPYRENTDQTIQQIIYRQCNNNPKILRIVEYQNLFNDIK